MGRIAPASDLVQTVSFLASDASSFMTGQIVTLDGGRSLISLAAFRKNIRDDIFILSTTGTFNGRDAILNIPQNASESDITGIEIGFTKNAFDFLPEPLDGLGVSVNFSYLSGNSTLLAANGTETKVDWVFEQPDYLLNAALFYQKGPVEMQLSYTSTGEYHAGFAGDPSFTDTFGAFSKLDFQARFDITERISLLGEIRNLTDEPLSRYTGPNGVLLNDQSDFRRSFALGLSAKF
jgi:outer membrane receptor for ferrienterochelin and colicin